MMMDAVIFEKSGWVEEVDPSRLRTMIEFAMNRAQFTLCAFSEHFFEPYGYSACWVIGESHIAVHTFHEKNLAYVQLSSCSREKFDLFCANIEIRHELSHGVIHRDGQ